MSQEKLETTVMQKSWGVIEVYFGIVQVVNRNLITVKSVLVYTRLRGYKRVLISLCRQWFMNRHKTEVNNIFEAGKVNCKKKTFRFST